MVVCVLAGVAYAFFTKDNPLAPADIVELTVLGAFALVAIGSTCGFFWSLVSWSITGQLNEKLLGISSLALVCSTAGFVIAAFGFEVCHMR